MQRSLTKSHPFCNQHIDCLCTLVCSNFPVDFIRFCHPQRRAAVYRPMGPTAIHLSRPPFAAVRPENGRKSTKNRLSTCFNTNAVFGATLPCILFRFWRRQKCTAVYCGIQAYHNACTSCRLLSGISISFLMQRRQGPNSNMSVSLSRAALTE